PKGTQTNALPRSRAAPATAAIVPSPPAAPSTAASASRASVDASSPRRRTRASIPLAAAAAQSPSTPEPLPERGLTRSQRPIGPGRYGPKRWADRLMTPAGAVPIIASYGRTRRAPSDRGRPLGDVGRGLGGGRRGGDRGLSREAPCVSRLPRGCRCLELTQVLLLFAETELALEDALRHRADGRCLRLAVLEQDHHRDRGDAVALRQPLLLVDVHLDDAHRVVVGDPVEHRRDGVARTTPFGPEVDYDLAFS